MPVFNPFVTTNTRLKRNKQLNEGATSGAAKTPRVGVNKSDLEAQGIEHGWTVRPLTMSDINQMSSAELRWMEEFNADNLAACFEKKANIEQNNRNQAWWDVRKKWTGVTAISNDEIQQMTDVANRFFDLYPQVIRNRANADKMWEFMKENNLPPTDIASPIQAFEALAQEGTITLNPSAISVGAEESVTGEALTKHRHFHLLLQSHRRPTAEESMSADQFKALHPELSDDRVPPLIAARVAKQKATEQFRQQSEAATSRSNGMSITDYKQGK